MDVSSLLSVEQVYVDTDISSKKRLLQYISEKSSEVLDMVEDDIFDCLLERERLGSTGLGHGFALPHARLNGLQTATALFLKLQQGIKYDAPDGESVDLVFALLIPEEATDEHLQILSSLASIFSQDEVCRKIRQALTSAQVLELIKQAEQ